MAERISGRTKPTTPPYCQPQISPHSRTGRCMGSSMLPTWGICPVKKGRTIPRARNMADSTRFRTYCLTVFFFIVKTPSQKS